MPNRGNLSNSINAGSYVDIPAGYYNLCTYQVMLLCRQELYDKSDLIGR